MAYTFNPRIPCEAEGCDIDFARHADLQRHVKEHHGGLLSCPEPNCPWRGAKRRSRLDIHLQKEHGDIHKKVDPLSSAMSAKKRGKGQRLFGKLERPEDYPATTDMVTGYDVDYTPQYTPQYPSTSLTSAVYENRQLESIGYPTQYSAYTGPAYGAYSSAINTQTTYEGYPSTVNTEPTYGGYPIPISTETANEDFSSLGSVTTPYSVNVPKRGNRRNQKASLQEDESIVTVEQPEAPQVPGSTGEEARQPLGPEYIEYSNIAEARTYFTRGRVFKAPWSMPAGSKTSESDPHVTKSAFEQKTYTEITRFIVWLAKPTHCLALAIHTYRGLGTDKFTLRPGDRSPVFDAREKWDKAQILRREIPIWVEDKKRGSIKYPNALVDFSQIFTIHFYVPILNIGYVPEWAWPAVEGCVRHSLNMISENDLSMILSNVANDAQRIFGSEVTDESQGDHQHSQAGQASEYDENQQWELQTYTPPTQWACDWLGCPKSLNYFSRIDHYRDHLRDFHSEDILGKKRKDASWFEGRNIYPDWWRCSHCLNRVRIEESGLDCDVCGRSCEPERQKFRASRFPL